MRTRAWRRYMEECVVKRRLKLTQSHGWYYFSDINRRKITYPIWSDFVGTCVQHMFKTYTTKLNDSKHKIKYSPNHTRSYWRDRGRKGKREKDKVIFRKMLEKEYGIKHYYTKY